MVRGLDDGMRNGFCPHKQHGSVAGMEAAARAVDLMKTYGQGDTTIAALDHVNVEFERGAFTAIMGPSSSGKSTLMHTMAGLDAFTSGEVWIGGGRRWRR